MKGNFYRKLYSCDRFGWRFYCTHTSRALRRSDKHRAVKSARVYRKNSCAEEYEC